MTTHRPRRTALRFVLPSLGICLPALAQNPDLGTTRAALERWVETRSVLGKEQRDWLLGKDLLESRIQLVQREIETVRARTAEAVKNTAEADQKRGELVAENERLLAAATGLQGGIAALEARVRALLQRLPEALRERASVKTLAQRLPEAAATTKLSLSERYLNVVGLLNEVDKFQREVTVTSEVRKLADGSSAEVTAVYLGIAQGFYVSNNGKAAGYGAATADGWQWTAADGAAERIRQVVAILKNEHPAVFVPVPAKLQ